MTNINCVVTTEPMAREINHVSKHIQGTTTAVVAMKAAVVQAEAEASEHVCANVNRGFYTLIHSQISQKIAKLQSDVDSRLMQLQQQKKQLLAIQTRMGRDYNMISARYLKLFNGLNQNLQQRIFELDKPTIEFAVKEVNKVSNRSKMLPALVPVSQLESLELSQKILASNLKYRGNEVIESMKLFLGRMNEQKALTRRVLLPNVTAADKSIAMPILIQETNYDKSDSKYFEVVVATEGMKKSARQAIESTVNNALGTLQWQDTDEATRAEIQSEFHKYMHADSHTSERTKQMMKALFEKNQYQSIKVE